MAGVLDIIVRATDQASGALDGVGASATRNIDSIQRTMQRTGTIMSAAVTAPMLLLGNTATDAATSLNESINAVNVVFGDAADKILDFSEGAVDQAGLSMRNFNQLVTPIGASLQNVGFGADEAAESSINLARRAADMSSVFDVEVSEALGAIQAGLRGEADSLERFGAGFTDVEVRAKAVAMGLADTASAVDANGIAQARLAIIMERTDRIAGDFARTADVGANAERKLGENAENAAAALGQKLLPIKQALISALGTLLDAWKGLSPEMQNAILIVGGVVAAIGPLLLIGSQLITLIKGIGIAMAFLAANPIVLIIAAVVALVAALVWLFHNNETFRDIVISVWNVVSGVIGAVAGAIGGYFSGIGQGIAVLWGIFETLRDIVARVFRGIRNVISSAVGWVLDRFGDVGRGIDAVIGFFRNLRDRVVGFVQGLVNTITGPIRFAQDLINTLNPFARHSPSLVENVQAGVRLIAREYASLADLQISAPMLGTTAVGGGRGGGITIINNIENFTGSEREIDRLGAQLARRLRLEGA